MLARPVDLAETLRLMREPGARVMAGGTDLFPAAGDRLLEGTFVSLDRCADLDGIRATENEIRIGANVTWSDLLSASLPAAFGGLQAAAREIGAVQIQNRATLAGNLCNASPAADGVPPLLTLDAEVELVSERGRRRIALADFLAGNRRTLRAADEILAAIVVPAGAMRGQGTFLKLGARRYLVISIAMVAVRLVIDATGRVGEARLAIGACSAVATRLPAAEAALIGRPADDGLAECLDRSAFDFLAPIDDLRASADYRRHAALSLSKSAVRACIAGSPGGTA